MSSFHGGVGAAIVLGGLIIGSDIRTANTPPYWQLGPSVNAIYSGSGYPAIQAVTANSARYDAASPSLLYADNGIGIKEMVLSAGRAGIDGKASGTLVLNSSDDAAPGGALLAGEFVSLASSTARLFIGTVANQIAVANSNIVDQHGFVIPSFVGYAQNFVVAAGSVINIANPFNNANVIPYFMVNTTAWLVRVNTITAATVQLLAYAPNTLAGAPAGTNIGLFGFIAEPTG